MLEVLWISPKEVDVHEKFISFEKKIHKFLVSSKLAFDILPFTNFTYVQYNKLLSKKVIYLVFYKLLIEYEEERLLL